MARHPRSLTVVLVVTMASSTFALAVISVLAADFIAEFDITREQLGLLVTASALAGAAAAPVLGPLADRVGAKAATLFALSVSALALLAMTVAPTFAWLALGAVMTGIPQGIANPATNMLILAQVPAGKRGVVTGIKQSGVQAGNAVGGVALPPIALSAGWRWGTTAAVAVPVLGLLLAWFTLPGDGGSRSRRDRGPRTTVGMARLATYGFLLGCGGTAVSTYLPLFSQERLGMTPVAAGATVAVMGVSGVVGRIVWGRLAEAWIGAGRSLTIVAGISTVVGLLLLGAEWLGAWVVWPVAVLTGISASSWNTLGMLAIIQDVPRDSTGRASGSLMLGFLTGVGVGAPLLGRSVDTFGGYIPGWAGTTVTFVAALVLMASAGGHPIRVPDAPRGAERRPSGV